MQKEDGWKCREKQGSTEVSVAEHVILFVMNNSSWMMFMGWPRPRVFRGSPSIEQCVPTQGRDRPEHRAGKEPGMVMAGHTPAGMREIKSSHGAGAIMGERYAALQ